MGMIVEGIFDGSNHESFWILNQVRKGIGFIRIFDLEDIDDGCLMSLSISLAIIYENKLFAACFEVCHGKALWVPQS